MSKLNDFLFLFKKTKYTDANRFIQTEKTRSMQWGGGSVGKAVSIQA